MDNGEIIVELKAVKNILDEHRAQVTNYLKAAETKLGILVNYGSHPDREHVRLAK